MSIFKRRKNMLTPEEIKKMTAEEKASLLALLQEETVVEELIQPQVGDTLTEVIEPVIVEEVKVEEAIVESTEDIQKTGEEEIEKVVEVVKPVVDYDLKFTEIETRFDEKLDVISKALLAKDKVITDLQSEIKELKRTTPLGGFSPKPSETKLTKDVETRESIVGGLRKSQSTLLVNQK